MEPTWRRPPRKQREALESFEQAVTICQLSLFTLILCRTFGRSLRPLRAQPLAKSSQGSSLSLALTLFKELGQHGSGKQGEGATGRRFRIILVYQVIDPDALSIIAPNFGNAERGREAGTCSCCCRGHSRRAPRRTRTVCRASAPPASRQPVLLRGVD